MREKYIDEKIGVWIEFGVHDDGNVDVADQEGDVFTNVTPTMSKELLKAQETFRKQVYEILRYY